MKPLLYRMLYSFSDIFIPLCWGVGIGLLFTSLVLGGIHDRAIKQDCEVMGTFRIGDKAFLCEPKVVKK